MFIKSSFSRFAQGIFLAALFILMPFFAFAQGVASSTIPDVSQGAVVANINLQNALLLEQSSENLVLSFVLQNADNSPQFDIRYGVELIKTGEDGSQSVADSFISREMLTLESGQGITKVIEYPIKTVAPGKYSIWISAQTSAGVVLGLGTAGEVTIATAEVLEIKADTCALSIVGETNTLYTLYQGVDIAGSEVLTLTCVVKNHGTEGRTVIPRFETFARTIFGDKVTVNSPEEAPVSFAVGEERAITLTVPKAEAPQAYDAVLTFSSAATRTVVSNKLTVHYVLQGVSATIQTVDFTKSNYAAGEEIGLQLFWTGSADGFSDSRQGEGTDIGGEVSASIQVVDGAGMACAPEFKKVLTEETALLTVVATANCTAPAATVSLIGPDGTVLDTTSIASAKDEADTNSPTDTPASGNTLMYVTIIALIIALTIILLAVTRHKREQPISK